MARRKSIRLGDDALTTLAAALVPIHGSLVADGYTLTGRRRLDRRKDGSLTARFTYRNRSEGVSVAFTVQGIRP